MELVFRRVFGGNVGSGQVREGVGVLSEALCVGNLCSFFSTDSHLYEHAAHWNNKALAVAGIPLGKRDRAGWRIKCMALERGKVGAWEIIV